MRLAVVLIGLACTGCFYTDPIATDEDTRFYDGTCGCLLCMDPAPPPGFCNGPTTEDLIPLEFCHIDIETNVAVGKLAALCQGVQDTLNGPSPTLDGVVARCGLVPVNDSTDQFDKLVNRGTARGVCRLEDRDRDPVGAAAASRATLHSQIRATGSDFSAVADVTGELEFYGGNCRTGSCPIKVTWLKLEGPRATITVDGDTTTLRNLVTVNQTEGTGTCSSLAPSFDACAFVLDPGSFDIMTSAFNPHDDERQIIYASSTDSGGGILSFASHAIAVTQVFSQDDTDIEFNLEGTVDNFAPHVATPPAFTVDCGRSVTVDAIIEDVDDPASTLEVNWFVDGDIALHGLGPLVADLSAGTHTVTILARDRHGAFGSATTSVTVAPDTTPPQVVSSASVCLWPPDHKYDVLTAADLSVVAVDTCDPSPTIEFLSGHSSQPDDFFGDGNTTSDVVVHTDSVCVRAERSGALEPGRTYELEVVAVDAAGNASTPATVTVTVPHGHSQLHDCDVVGGTETTEDDPRCLPEDPQPVGQTDFTRPSRGCSTGGDQTGMLLVVGALLAVRRRRKR